MENSVFEIDGSALEGGGQIVRNAIAYSCLLHKSIKVTKIRSGRSNPGLRPQHVCGIQLVRDLCKAKFSGNEVGSTEISFEPQEISAGSFLADTRTAGSICLLLQTALPCMMFAKSSSHLTLKGGTNADMAPQLNYLLLVAIPIFSRIGLDLSCDIIRRGFYPKGGGEIKVDVKPVKTIKSIQLLDSGKVVRVKGIIFVSGVLSMKLTHTMEQIASSILQSFTGPVSFNIEKVKFDQRQAVGNGSGLVIVAETDTGCLIAGSALGNRDKSAENVGREAAEMLLRNIKHGVCVDEYLQDQLIIFMALASGKSSVKCGPITLHTKTAIHVAQQLTSAQFAIDSLDEFTNVIHCEGIQLRNSEL